MNLRSRQVHYVDVAECIAIGGVLAMQSDWPAGAIELKGGIDQILMPLFGPE